MIKSSIIIFIALFSCTHVFAQSINKGLPPFKIRLVNGEGYTYNQLEKNKPVILIYFSPTCGHCKTFTEAMLKRINNLQDRQIIMISYEDIKQVMAFNDTYKLSNHQNIKIGSEGYTFVVQKYYNIQHFPFVAEFGKNGLLKKIISWNLKPGEIAAQL